MSHKTTRAFIDQEGKIKQVPVSLKKRCCVLSYLIEKFEENRRYNEKEVNEIISQWHTFNDYFLLRRLLVDEGYLLRTPDGSKYWVNSDKRGEDCG